MDFKCANVVPIYKKEADKDAGGICSSMLITVR